MIPGSSSKILSIQIQREFHQKNFEIGEIDSSRKFTVYLVPIELLTLNPNNARFQSEFLNYGTKTDSFHYQKEGQKQISTWIFDHNYQKNVDSEKDVEVKGQQYPGVITADGLIINGNRRFTFLNRLYKRHQTHKYSTFKTIILNEVFSNNYKKIKELEFKIQFGKDKSLDYKRIDKMLSIRDYKKDNPLFSDKQIKKFCKWDGSITDLELTLKYIDDYIQFCHFRGYHFVDGVEDQFKYLSKTHKKIQAKKDINSWKPINSDFKDYKLTCFKILRSKPNQPTFRSIVAIREYINVFSNENIWKKFKKKIDVIYVRALKATKNFQLNIERNQKRKMDISEFEDDFKSKMIRYGIKSELLSTANSIRNLRDKNEPERLINELDGIITRINEIICDKKVFIKDNDKKELKKCYQIFLQLINKIEN